MNWVLGAGAHFRAGRNCGTITRTYEVPGGDSWRLTHLARDENYGGKPTVYANPDRAFAP